MSPFSHLRDPTFLLTWQVHVVTVSLFALVGIWAGLNRRAWYLGPLVFCGLLWLFVPLEAPEPAIVLLASVPPLAIFCRLFRTRWLPQPEVVAGSPQPGWRFKLVDLFWLTLLSGLFTALVTQCWRMKWKIVWPEVVISSVCFSLLAIATVLGSRQKTWLRQSLAMGGVVLLIAAAAGVHSEYVRKDWLLQDWESLIASLAVLGSTPQIEAELFLVTFGTFGEFVLLTALGLELILPPAIRMPRQLTMASRVMACGCLGLLVVGLASVYVAIFQLPGWPEEAFPARNERERFLAILERQHSLNPQSASPDELRAAGNAGSADTIADLLDELEELLKRDDVTMFDSRFDRPDVVETHFGSIVAARGAARTLTAQARADWEAGRREDALRRDATCLRLAAALQRRGTMVDALVGVAVENMALHRLGNVRVELSCDETGRFMPLLESVAASREPVELLLARDSVYDQEVGGWRSRLSTACRRLLRQESKGVYRQAFDRRDAILTLTSTDLALRCHWRTHGRLPERLDEFVPQPWPRVPIDPYSGRPLIYRIADEDFVLYSVGPDGVDDGGKFGDSGHSLQPGYDFDLDMWWR